MSKKGKSKRQIQYEANKIAKVGEEIVCPICGEKFTKKQYAQAFCCSKCKESYWNAKGDRHADENYHRHYNMKHPERLERVGIYQDYEGEFGYYDCNGDFRTFREDFECEAMCENPILGI